MDSVHLENSLVTGGAGFIGSHLVERLIREGSEVTVLDNFATGRLANIEHLSESEQLHIHHVDISKEPIDQYFDDIDCVFHLAALAEIVPSIQHPELYYRTNVEGTFNVVQASVKSKVKRFIYAASSSCYGIPDQYPTPESAEMRPLYPYALTKYLGEQIVIHWCKVYDLSALSLRLFNVYGPRSRTSDAYGAVFGVFLAQKLANQSFTVVGDGTQTRDFTFVGDVADAFVTAAYSAVAGESINVGSGNTYSVNRLVELLGGDVTYIPKRPGEPDCTLADTKKMKTLLGWTAKIKLEEGVRILLDDIDYWKEAPVWNPTNIANATTDWFKYLKNA